MVRSASNDLPKKHAVKGNISWKGDKIYHVPGERDHDCTPSEAAGERMFCSEDEAKATGWRAPRG